MVNFIKRFAKWLRLFPAMIFPGWGLDNYLSSVRRTVKRYDMVESAHEDYFCDRYMHIIDSVLKSRHLDYKELKVLDVGCGQGRLSLQFLKRGSIVDAVDAVPEALKKAALYAKEAGVDTHNINWIEGEIPAILLRLPSESYNMIVCTEVLYMIPDPEKSIKRIAEKLSAGGILIISVRTRLYYLLHSLMHNDPVRFRIAAENENYSSISKVLSWTDPDNTEKMLRGLKLSSVERYGIGVLSGIEGDPSGQFCRPGILKKEERIFLAQTEDNMGKIYPDAGRYIVFSAVKE